MMMASGTLVTPASGTERCRYRGGHVVFGVASGDPGTSAHRSTVPFMLVRRPTATAGACKTRSRSSNGWSENRVPRCNGRLHTCQEREGLDVQAGGRRARLECQ